MKKIKSAAIFAIFVAGIVCFSGCKGKNESSAASAGKIVLTVAARGGTHADVIEAVLCQ